MSFLVVANFKSHKSLAEVKSWIGVVTPAVSMAKNLSVIMAPSTIHLSDAHAQILSLKSNIALAAQDVSPFPVGAYTGAVNASQLKDVGVTHAIIGHSERRTYFHETHQDIASKAKELLDAGITPIICLREEDVTTQRASLEDSLITKCVFCYEPPGSIGGTEIDSLTDIESVTHRIQQMYAVESVMYGGSVNASNVTDLLKLKISGVLVATASLDPSSFNEIIESLSHANN